ncbi:MAG TPA: leucine--tRNA ligase, partial [Anaerolineales bacterium]
RSAGVEVSFLLGNGHGSMDKDRKAALPSEDDQPRLTVFTTRPDTLYGVTFMVLAPEHPLVDALTSPEQHAGVEAYRSAAALQSEVNRMDESREKTGIFTGGYAIHPLNGEPIPVWIADYVLPGYGTGAVMGVPAHDVRDFEFARKYGLPVKPVILPVDQAGRPQDDRPLEATIDEGVMVNSGPFNGLASDEGGRAVCAALEQRGLGRRATHYRMRDWLISRQRYWGTPIPIVYCDDCGEVPVPIDQLPVLLPAMTDFQPDGSGRSPLARLPEFVHTTCPQCGGPGRRETDTMGGFACSSWYFLRFTSPHYDQGPFEPQAMRYWMPVDIYVGGSEHAVLHLLYARVWTRVMADAGLLPYREPFTRLLNQGQLLAPDGRRMSKSRGNVITPDAMVASYGADALRVYEMFMAPFDQDIAWSTDGINGARRFLNRVWTLYGETYFASIEASKPDPDLDRSLHQAIRRIGERIETFRFNTMISALMEFTNLLIERQRLDHWHSAAFHQALDTLLVLLAPAAPHIAEELWQITGHTGSVHRQPWPIWDPILAKDELVRIGVQLDGKMRDVIEIPIDAQEAEALAQAYAQPKIQQHLAGRATRQVFYVPGKILNILTERPGF